MDWKGTYTGVKLGLLIVDITNIRQPYKMRQQGGIRETSNFSFSTYCVVSGKSHLSELQCCDF